MQIRTEWTLKNKIAWEVDMYKIGWSEIELFASFENWNIVANQVNF